MNRKDYETRYLAYLALAEEGDLTKIHTTSLQRRELYTALAALYYRLWKDAPVAY